MSGLVIPNKSRGEETGLAWGRQAVFHRPPVWHLAGGGETGRFHRCPRDSGASVLLVSTRTQSLS